VVVRLFTRAREQCEHVPDQAVDPRADACQDCGSRFNLRVCTECGYVGCCESQLGHDRDHAMQTGHAVIRSLPLSEHSFTWCYACHRYV
jgi:monovalent cation/hydrogen antiporter